MRRPFAGTGQLWPVLASLLFAVLIPTTGLFWYMNQARRGEEAAVRLRLAEAYRSQLQSAAVSLQQEWQLKSEGLSRRNAGLPAAQRFAAAVAEGGYDAVIVLSPSGEVRYPTASAPPGAAPDVGDEGWNAARRAEFEANDPARAARLYADIARQQRDVHLSAQAWQGRARSLLKAGQSAAAIEVLTGVLAAPRYRAAVDEQGRWIAPNALLLALQRLPDRSPEKIDTLAARLEARLVDYTPPALPAGQRRFLWNQLTELVPSRPMPAVIAAEELAAAVLAEGVPRGALGLTPSGLPAVWALSSTDRTVVALLRESRIVKDLEGQLRRQTAGDAHWQILVPAASQDGIDGQWTVRLSEPLRDWVLRLRPSAVDEFSAAARERTAVRLWTTTLLVVSIALLTFVAGQRMSRQVQSTRLKDDLLATVSHELKTPLSSMRVLVDTLLAGHVQDPHQQREYLEIIARENQRLSGLIEDFLTFSRLERGRHVFEFSRVGLPDVVDRALASIGDRVRGPECRFEVSLEPDLPPVRADRDALVTVVLNLVDNALKYSGPQKHIVVRGYRRHRDVCLEVEDNGIGFSRRIARRIFERFFQADRDAAGSAAGVGLGLSIVKSIVTAHHGRIDVASQPGKGSRFTVCLPSAS
jgi:signal transduction histidine kinase